MAKNKNIKVFLLISTLFVLFKSSEGINCYQCTGIDPQHQFQCKQWLDSDADIEPQSCDHVHDAKYCIKQFGRYEGGIGAKRFCSSLDLGNYCNYVQQPGDKLESYRTCIYTCSSDGCNSSAMVKVGLIILVIPFLLLFMNK